MKADRVNLIVGVIILLFLLSISLPYLAAQSQSNEERIFGGFLLNPIDGNSYLAKMRQGYEGSWLFKLPYTSNPGSGAPLNLYYLFLGHVARWFRLPLIFVFHLARITGAFLLALAVYRLMKALFSQPSARFLAFTLALFGSGMGWLAAAFGVFTSDFWVAEAYPFLTGFTNAHFPLGMALQVWLITPSTGDEKLSWRRIIATLLGSALLSIIYPFGWVVAAAVTGVSAAWLLWKKADWQHGCIHWLSILLGGAPYMLYSIWVVSNHPVLRLWNAQNLTPASGLLDLLISFSPLLIFIAIGIIAFRFQLDQLELRIITIWLIVGVLLVYLPISLQRRLISGLYVPMAAFAVLLFSQVRRPLMRTGLTVTLFALALPTNLLILSGSYQASQRQDEALFVYRAEAASFAWLDSNAQPGSVVLSSTRTGLLIPAYADVQTVVGHPFETVDATAREAEVKAFFAGQLSDEEITQLLSEQGVDYIFYGPREGEIGTMPVISGMETVYDQGGVQIWASVD
jgi:hypothetical protein